MQFDFETRETHELRNIASQTSQLVRARLTDHGRLRRFYLSSSSSCSSSFSSPNLSRRRLDDYHTSTHNLCGLSANLECMPKMWCMRLAENTRRKNYTKPSQLRHVSTIGKKLLNNNISSTYLHNMANSHQVSCTFFRDMLFAYELTA